MSDFVDILKNPLKPGQKVFYTTNAEGGGLILGRIVECYLAKGNYGDTKKVKIEKLNLDGSPKMETTYVGGFPAGDARNWEDTDRPVRASIIDYRRDKIYVLGE